MKALKITLALMAIVMLTVSGVKSENIVNDEPTYESHNNFDLLAIDKKKLEKPTHG